MKHSKQKQNIIAKFNALSKDDKAIVLTACNSIIDSNPAPLEALRIKCAGNAELVSAIDNAIQSITGKQGGEA